MILLTLIWMIFPLFFGLGSYLIPKAAKVSTLITAIASFAYGLHGLMTDAPLTFQLLDSYGITLLSDTLSGYFILTNALVTAAVVCYCWPSAKTAFFYTQLMILHGSVNSVFICADLMSLYVALEVISIAAFLLMTYARTDQVLWVGLRYLFISNVAMLFYLMGAILVYQSNQSFAFTGLQNAPKDAIALMVLGLVVKGGIFISGLWLPMTHAEVETPISAMLSGVVIKTGVYPLIRFALIFDAIEPIFQILSAGTALLGVSLALFQKDTKRVLAFSTISQMGFMLVNPAMSGLYALTHGLAKSVLFLLTGNFPSREFDTLRQQPIALSCWIPMAIACLSVMGSPGLGGFGAKLGTLSTLTGTTAIVMNIAAIGTVILLSKFLFLPTTASSFKIRERKLHLWIPVGVLVLMLLGLTSFQLDDYTLKSLQKASLTLLGGWGLYWGLRGIKQLSWVTIPQSIENLDHLIGGMSLVLFLLLWMVWL